MGEIFGCVIGVNDPHTHTHTQTNRHFCSHFIKANDVKIVNAKNETRRTK